MLPFLFVALAGLAAFVTPWPVLRRLIEPGSFMNSDIERWGAMWGWVGALAVLAWVIGQRDRWMGIGVGYLALTPLFSSAWRGELLLVAILALGITMSAGVKTGGITTALGCLGLAEAVVVYLQALGYDPLWNGMGYDPHQYVGGTFSHSGTAGGFLALTGLAGPAWMLAIIAPAVVFTRSRAAVVALAIGLVVRYWSVLPTWSLAVVALAALAILAALTRTGDPLQSVKLRAVVQAKALAYTARTSPVLGLGFGRWHEYKMRALPPKELNGVNAPLNPLHNDLAQWIVETGLAGAFILAMWLRARWRDFRCSPVAPALAAAVVLALTWYPLHMMPTGAVIAALLGLSTPTSQGT